MSFYLILTNIIHTTVAWAATAAAKPAQAVAQNSPSTLDLVLDAGPVAKFVLLILLLASVFSWAVILAKHKTLRRAKKQSDQFLDIFWHGQDLEEVFSKTDGMSHSPVGNIFKAGFKELKKISQIEGFGKETGKALPPIALDNINRALGRATISEISVLEKSVSFLASIGSTAPFIGLFGTVWGIMDSFQGIGATGTANLAVVAPGISEALIATAAGLVAAIPAVMAYNHFINRIKNLATEMDTFSQDFLNLVQRSLLKG